MIPYHETAYSPDFRKLSAIVGSGKMSSDIKWAPWQRLQSIYGWPLLLQAAEKLEPAHRWPNELESQCMALKRSLEQNKAYAEARERMETERAKSKASDRIEQAKTFADIRKRLGL
jgi:hypothetical protein